MYEIINSAIDFIILVLEGFLAVYFLVEMLPIEINEPTKAKTVETTEIITPRLIEPQVTEIIEIIPQNLDLSVKELVLIAKQCKIVGYARMRKSQLQRALTDLGQSLIELSLIQ
jgi:Rho termination factor, N-terminal domain